MWKNDLFPLINAKNKFKYLKRQYINIPFILLLFNKTMAWLNKEQNVKKVFRIFIVLKWIFAGLQLITGVLLFAFSQSIITKLVMFLTQGELLEDPRDYIAIHLLQFGTNFSSNTKLIIAIYLISHGLIKFYLLHGLWRNKLNAYPLSAVIFSLFMFYQLYRYQFSHSIWLLLLSLFDIVYIVLILHEYRIIKKQIQLS